VTLATHRRFHALASAYGLGVAPVEGDLQALLRGDAGQALMATRNPVAFLRRLRAVARPILAQGLRDAWAACRDAQALVVASAASPALGIAERLGVPAFLGVLLPQGPTRAFPSPLVAPGRRLGGPLNYATHALFEVAFALLFWDEVNAWRQATLGLPSLPVTAAPRRARLPGTPRLYGYSRLIVPRPADWPPDWHVTGYWFLDAAGAAPAWTPPAALTAFLAAGPPPVYVGFGSMAPRDVRPLAEAALAALRRCGRRGVLAAGWAGLGEAGGGAAPDDVFRLPEAPHDWLFPRMAAVVHHGGAGTTAAGLRAGVPTVVTPVFGDQPFWGQRVAALGAGPPPVPLRELTAARLAAAIRQATGDPRIRTAAADLGRRLRAEDGVRAAVAVVERHLSAGIG
jgi:UDP:flavonoid glycosyltransferase YjiC (YdhE family)